MDGPQRPSTERPSWPRLVNVSSLARPSGSVVQLRSGGRPANAEAPGSRRRLSQRYELEFDDREQRFYVRGRQLALPLLQTRLLTFLVYQAGRVLSATELLETLWGPQYSTAHHLLHSAMNRLRTALGPDGARLIRGRRGFGYLCVLEPPSPEANLTER